MTEHVTRAALLALERRLVVQAGLIRALSARLDEQGGAIRRAWERIEAGARDAAPTVPCGTHLAPPAPCNQIASPSLEPRVAAAQAAEVLGCDVRTVRRLVASGALRGDSRRLAGRRRHWSVSTADLERLIAKGGSPAAPAASKPPIPGARRSGAKG